MFSNIPQKTPKDQAKLDKKLDQWDRIWSYSSYYVERLKTVEITLTGLEEVTTVVTEFEMKLASYDSMSSDMDNLRKAHCDLMTSEAEIQNKQGLIDQLQEDVKHVRPSVALLIHQRGNLLTPNQDSSTASVKLYPRV